MNPPLKTEEPRRKEILRLPLTGPTITGGITFQYDPSLATGHRVWHVERVGGKWEPTAEYTVVTNSMLAGGGHSYRTLTKGEKRTEHGSQYETIRQWFEKNSPVATPTTGRIEKAILTKPK